MARIIDVNGNKGLFRSVLLHMGEQSGNENILIWIGMTPWQDSLDTWE